MKVNEFQRLIEDIYGGKDRARGTAGTYMWFCEEVGELSRALRRGIAIDLKLTDALGRACHCLVFVRLD